MKNYRALFERAIAELNSNADIDVSVAEIGEPAAADEIADIEGAFGLRIPQDVKDFYRQIGPTKIAWRFSEPMTFKGAEYPVDGRIEIVPVHDVFWGRGDLGWRDCLWFDGMDKNHEKRMRSLKPVDFFDIEDNGCVGLTVEGKAVSSRLTLHSTGGGYHPLSLELDRYVELVTQAKGLHRWQFSMVESRVSDNGIFKETMKKYLPRLFADKEQVQVFRTSLENASKARPARSK